MDVELKEKGDVDDFDKLKKVSFVMSSDENVENTSSMKCMKRIYPAGFWSMLRPMLILTWPILVVQLTQFTFSAVALMFCGHLGKYELDAVALANTAITVTSVTTTMGITSACDTLFAQIYGSKNKKLTGVVLQRSFIINTLALIPCIAIHLNIEALLLAFGQNPTVAKLTGEYVLVFMPATIFFLIFATVVKYLNNQNIVYPSMIIGIVACGTNILLHYIFLSELRWSINGSAIAQDISYGIMAIFNVLYLYISKVYEKTWPGWTVDCLQEWGEFCRLAISGLIMICTEWWAFEVGIILAGTLGTVELGAQSILFQYDVIYYMFPLAFSISTGIIVGQALGANDIVTAKTAARVGITCGTTIGAIAGILIISLKQYLPLVFTNDSDVVDMTSSVLPVLGFYMTFSAIANVWSGVVRGLGQQQVGALICIVNYGASVVGGVTWMLMTKQIIGFWISLAGMLLVTAISYFTYISCVDWHKMAQHALCRAKVIDKNHNEDRDDITESVEEKVDQIGSQIDSKFRESVLGIGSQYLRDDLAVTTRLSKKALAIRRIPVLVIFIIIFVASISFRICYELPYENLEYFDYLKPLQNITQD